MKKSLFIIALFSTVGLASLNADFIGFEAGASYWNSKVSGDFKKGTTNVNFKDNLGYNDSTGTNVFYAQFEHPIPFIPNIRIQQTNLNDSANSAINNNINFAGQTFSASSSVSSKYKLNQTDFVFYYELLDNWVNLDLGLNVKYIDGEISLATSTISAKETFDTYIPMAYIKGQFDLPFTGLSAEAELNYIGYDGSRFHDVKVGIRYETSIGLGAEVGYREERIKIDDLKDFNSDIKFSGAYASLFYHF